MSSLEMATTGTLYFFTSGSTSSRRSSSPVTELTSGRPCAVSRPACSAPGTELSMQSGASTSAWIRATSCGISIGSTKLLSA